ncbi:MAG: hypothetical protein KIH08_11850 [Candidatus Freyarchaeota archaeon]|nr:hypothetical protein [Candidatus Jordarchaeia archaeon]MBS7269325.1 hypothetical protein [Candidatus Jordarchaeia archaeon]MBS7281131.1 hypothetical protein [Candidatus Jordarchaeia archaeon]
MDNDASWKIPEFSIVARPSNSQWPNRVEEELRIFQIWRDKCVDLYNYAPFDNLKQNPTNNRLFTCVFKFPESTMKKRVELALPLDYPSVPPEVSRGRLAIRPFVDYEFSANGPLFLRISTSKNPCLGALGKLWRQDGRWGIPHFLNLLCIYISIFLKDYGQNV